MSTYQWPYKNEIGQEGRRFLRRPRPGRRTCRLLCGNRGGPEREKGDRCGKRATERSGAAGSGFDHWESACTNPLFPVTPKGNRRGLY